MPELLLLSNSTNHGGTYLGHALDEIADFWEGVTEVLFVPFAGARHNDYTAQVAGALSALGIKVRGLHTVTDSGTDSGESVRAAIASAEAVFVGGGNTFRLVKALQDHALLAPMRAAVAAGTRYLGASAGTNIAAPSLATTNDMPIVEPSSFETLGLVPFQINPHFIDPDPASRHNGETREKRLAEFHEENSLDVLGLREGTHLRVSGTAISETPPFTKPPEALPFSSRPKAPPLYATIGGVAVARSAPGPAVLFRRGETPREISGDVRELFLTTGPSRG